LGRQVRRPKLQPGKDLQVIDRRCAVVLVWCFDENYLSCPIVSICWLK
jgi:hypothetical protein